MELFLETAPCSLLLYYYMHAIILAGGFGTRLARISGDKPKLLMEVGGKPILEHQVEFLLKHGIQNIRLSLHHKADQIISFCENRWPGKMDFRVESKPLGTGGAIKFASRGIQDDFLVLNGDLLSDIDLKKFIKYRANAICCYYSEDARDFGLLKIKKGKVREFLEKPKDKISGFVNGGIYFLSPKIFSDVTQNEFMIEKEVFPKLAEKGKLNAYIHNGFWIDVGTEERWRIAQAKLSHT